MKKRLLVLLLSTMVTSMTSEVIYEMSYGRLAALPAVDLCDWFEITIKQQNKEWFGWRTSTNSAKWFK